MGHTAKGNGGLVTGAGYPRCGASSPLSRAGCQSFQYARASRLKNPPLLMGLAAAGTTLVPSAAVAFAGPFCGSVTLSGVATSDAGCPPAADTAVYAERMPARTCMLIEATFMRGFGLHNGRLRQ